MPLGYDKKIYIMAFDHRGSFIKLFGLSGTLPPGPPPGWLAPRC